MTNVHGPVRRNLIFDKRRSSVAVLYEIFLLYLKFFEELLEYFLKIFFKFYLKSYLLKKFTIP